MLEFSDDCAEGNTRRRFAVITAAALIGMVVTASLGRWQLHRAAEKEAYQAEWDARAAMPALDGQTLAARMTAIEQAGIIHRQVVLRGTWLTGHTVYLDNRQMQGRQGFYVMTPLRLESVSPSAPLSTVLVQRGWVPRNFEDRHALPALTTPPGVVQVHGRIAGQPAKLLELQTPAADPGASQIRQNLDTEQFAREIGQPLSPLTVVQTDSADDGLVRDWPVVGSGVERHYGYAFQWLGLCSLIAILYAWFQFVRPVLRRRLLPNSSRGG